MSTNGDKSKVLVIIEHLDDYDIFALEWIITDFMTRYKLIGSNRPDFLYQTEEIRKAFFKIRLVWGLTKYDGEVHNKIDYCLVITKSQVTMFNSTKIMMQYMLRAKICNNFIIDKL